MPYHLSDSKKTSRTFGFCSVLGPPVRPMLAALVVASIQGSKTGSVPFSASTILGQSLDKKSSGNKVLNQVSGQKL